MESLERIKALLAKKPVDRVPVWLWLQSSDFTSYIAGYPLSSIYSDPDKCFRAQLLAQDMYGSDDISLAKTAPTKRGIYPIM